MVCFHYPVPGEKIHSANGNAIVEIKDITFLSNGNAEISLACKIDGDKENTETIVVGYLTGVAVAVSDNGRMVIAVEDNFVKRYCVTINENGEYHLFSAPKDVEIEAVSISETGKYFCYETSISADAEYNQRLFVLNQSSGNIISSFSVGDLFGHGVFPDIEDMTDNEVTFKVGDFSARVSYDGKLLNKQDYFKYRFVKAYNDEHGYGLFRISEEMPPAEQIAVLGTVLKKKLDDKTRAKVNRRIAEIMDNHFSWYEKAEHFYQEALNLDPNVGCKKALEKCKENIERSAQ